MMICPQNWVKKSALIVFLLESTLRERKETEKTPHVKRRQWKSKIIESLSQTYRDQWSIERRHKKNFQIKKKEQNMTVRNIYIHTHNEHPKSHYSYLQQ